MYKIKQKAEDFIVKEVSNVKVGDSGKYLVCLLKKKNYTTLRAIEHVANKLNVKDIGFAGAKDKNAVTEQYISIRGVKKLDSLELKDISLEFIGYSDLPISLGDLEGNEFTIVIRDLSNKEKNSLNKKDIKKIMMPNFFGEQRFSERNIAIGKNLLKSRFKEAVKLIFESEPDCKAEMDDFLKDKPNDFIGALKLMPKKLLMMYMHAYQSFLFNMTLNQYIKTNKKNISIPLIGFGTEIENPILEKIINKIMEKEKLTFRSFINSSIPVLSLEGAMRDAFVSIDDLEILEEKDFVKIKFFLKKASYGTVAVGFLLN